MPKYFLVMVFIAFGLIACNDNNSSGSRGPVAPPPSPSANTVDITVDLNTLEVTTGGAATGSASADLTVNLDDRSITGAVLISDLDASVVTVKYGFAGEEGPQVVALTQDSPTQWSIPVDTVFEQTDIDRLNAGALYVEVATAANPEGALRGQLLVGNIRVYPVLLSAQQQVPPITSNGSAVGFITFNADTNAIVVHVNTVALDDATMAHVHQAIAGINGPVLIALTQDIDNASHWLSEDASLDTDGLAAFNAGELYINIHTPDNMPGEVRGQIVPAGVEVTFTALSGSNIVVAGATGSGMTAYTMAATTVITASQNATFHINTVDLEDATAASVNQAPAGQNGPPVFVLAQDSVDLFRWSADNITLSQAQYAAMRSRGLYFTVATPDYPDGKVRGQLEPENSMVGGPDTLQVLSINPAAAAELTVFPNTLTINFNRALLADTVNNTVVTIIASGGDGSFSDGNEVPVTGFAVSVNTAVLTVDLTGIAVEDDVFQVSLQDNQITDAGGVILDGDADGNPGGQFTSAFSVVGAPSNATFTFIQNTVFTPSCTSSGCHSGASPAAGQNLSAGQAFANIVGVASVQMPGLNRIEAFDPDNSYLIRKIEGTAGSRMPLGRAPLSPELISTIRQWVAEGAQNN